MRYIKWYLVVLCFNICYDVELYKNILDVYIFCYYLVFIRKKI